MTTQIHPLRLTLNKAETAGAFFVILSNLHSVKKRAKSRRRRRDSKRLEKRLTKREHRKTN